MGEREDFLNYLRDEKLKTQKSRDEFIKLKFLLIAGMFGIGNWKFSGVADNYLILYFVPLIGAAIDLYIYGANFAIRRIGCYVREMPSPVGVEKGWEAFVDENRDPFTQIGIITVTLLIFISTYFILECKQDNIIRVYHPVVHYGWFIVNVAISCILVWISFFGFAAFKRTSATEKVRQKKVSARRVEPE